MTYNLPPLSSLLSPLSSLLSPLTSMTYDLDPNNIISLPRRKARAKDTQHHKTLGCRTKESPTPPVASSRALLGVAVAVGAGVGATSHK